VLGKAEGDGTTGHDLSLQLLLWNTLEKALIMTAPGAENPILRAYILENIDHLLLISVIEMNRCFDMSGIKFRGNIFFKFYEIA
jgi:hypothetical protein